MIFGKWTHAGRRPTWVLPTLRFCVAALPGTFFFPKNLVSEICNLKQCFLHSTNKILNGTRLDRCGLKSECIRFPYGTKSMTRKFKI